jgi:hypothetical protein
MIRRTALVALATLLAVAPAGHARRAPTVEEAKTIRTAVRAFVERPGPPAARSAVRWLTVSTVDSRYALVRLRTPGLPVRSTAILERRGSRWRVVTFGVAGFAFKGIPETVLNDLLGATICDCS